MTTIYVYDPPLCCPTGICGPNVDQNLINFAADLDWLKNKGITVERYNLAQQPDKFVESSQVKNAMTLAGDLCLPIILLNGEIVSRNNYPDRSELAALVGINLDRH